MTAVEISAPSGGKDLPVELHALCTQLEKQYRDEAQIYLSLSNVVKESQKQLIERWNIVVEAQNVAHARFTDLYDMLSVHNSAASDLLSRSDDLSELRQQILTANAAFHTASGVDVARNCRN
jgi:hypothetical protein